MGGSYEELYRTQFAEDGDEDAIAVGAELAGAAD
jgi:hypothetical protein